ncbi:FeoB-associated Cys-rich membrane protein [Collibacillus ludicampi]|uniref:FeoB-associated Cys-rich membrane protein n=1 Tax=Collibacillus ludicampi TaxID=2771369 RepID=UPI002495892D|nr:FeoB-associated Cys-rich membrane protein [Collibacillus ludicampi]
MIYVVIVAVLGFAAWQLFSFVKRTKKGYCASGCGSCAASGNCSIQKSELLQIEE